jgi:hypothetical protein
MAIFTSPNYADIKVLIEAKAGIRVTDRKPVRVHGVLEWHSNCPWCPGSTDSFIMHPEEGTYSHAVRAKGCGRYGDMVRFLEEFCSMSKQEAFDELGLDGFEGISYIPRTYTSLPSAPDTRWQSMAQRIVDRGAVYINAGLSFIRKRGINDGSVLDFKLGCVPSANSVKWFDVGKAEEWGLEPDAVSKNGYVRIPEGLLIPWYVKGKIWKLQVRRTTELGEHESPYHNVSGSSDCLFNQDAVRLDKPVIIVESAFCAIVGTQEAGDLAAFVALGSAKAHQNTQTVAVFEQALFALVALDNDEPDQRGFCAGDEGSRYWLSHLADSMRWKPYRKDINDMLLAGDSIREWVEDGIEQYYHKGIIYNEIKTIRAENIEQSHPAQNTARSDDPRNNPIVKKIMRLFDATMTINPPGYGLLKDGKRTYPYHPMTLPALPRAKCPHTVPYEARRRLMKSLLCGKPALAHGWCEEHAISQRFLELGAQLGFPTLDLSPHWSVRAGVAQWEVCAQTWSQESLERDCAVVERMVSLSSMQKNTR